MFGIGWTEFIFIAIIALVFVGPKHLPGMMQKLGRIVAELKSASRELRDQFEAETSDIESPGDMVRDLGRDLQKDLPSPYAEVERAERRLRSQLGSATKEVNAELSQTSSKDPALASKADAEDEAEPSNPPEEARAAAPSKDADDKKERDS